MSCNPIQKYNEDLNNNNKTPFIVFKNKSMYLRVCESLFDDDSKAMTSIHDFGMKEFDSVEHMVSCMVENLGRYCKPSIQNRISKCLKLIIQEEILTTLNLTPPIIPITFKSEKEKKRVIEALDTIFGMNENVISKIKLLPVFPFWRYYNSSGVTIFFSSVNKLKGSCQIYGVSPFCSGNVYNYTLDNEGELIKIFSYSLHIATFAYSSDGYVLKVGSSHYKVYHS
ncbi:hypothetical protein ABK040_010973 [Willaertia magna]